LDRLQRPLFRPGVRGIDEGFGEVDFAAVAEVFREALQEPIKSARPLPLLKAPVAGLVGRIATRQVVPRRAGAQHPEHAVQHGARIRPRASTPIGT
jgi:hypothetical protein